MLGKGAARLREWTVQPDVAPERAKSGLQRAPAARLNR